MPRKVLKTSLEELKKEVNEAIQDRSESSLEEVRVKLDAILDDIDELADESIKEDVKRIDESLSELEVSHPKITNALNQVMHLLSSVGI